MPKLIAKRDESQDNLETFDKNTSFFVEDDNIRWHPEEDLVMGTTLKATRTKTQQKKMPKDVLEHFRSMSGRGRRLSV